MFRPLMEKIVNACSGGLGAVLMGYDGIGIEQFSLDENPLNLDLVGIEYSNIAKEIRTAAEVLQIGGLEEVTIKTDRFYLIIQSLTEDYFVALVIDRAGNFGQGRYLLRRDAPALREALL